MGLPNYPCYRPLGRADWAFILGWRQGLGCFIGLASSLGLASGPACLFFKPYQLTDDAFFNRTGLKRIRVVGPEPGLLLD